MKTIHKDKRGFFENDRYVALVLTFAFFAVWVTYGLISSELYSDDDLGHFMIARYAPRHPEMFFDIWGRPVFTLLYSPGAQLGLVAGRITSAVIGAAVCYLGYIYARNRGYKRPYLFIVLLGFMARFWLTCYNLDTGLSLCLVLVAALVLLSKDRYVLAAMAISLAPAARPEGILYVFVFAAALLFDKKWKAVPFAFTGLLLWDIIPFALYGDPLWLLHNQPWTNPYWQSEFLLYFKKLTEITGPVQLPLFLVGILFSLRNWRMKDRGFLVLAWVSYFVFLVITSWSGAFSTVGLTRYFNGTTPIVALLALDGLNWLLDSEKGALDAASFVLLLLTALFLGFNSAWGYPYFLATIFLALAVRILVLMKHDITLPAPALVAGIVLISLVAMYPPFKVPDLIPRHKVMLGAAQWYKANGRGRYFLCYDMWFNYFAGIDPYDKSKEVKVTRENLEKAPRGSLVIWEPHYAGGERYGDISVKELLYNRSYRLLFYDEEEDWASFVFEKV